MAFGDRENEGSDARAGLFEFLKAEERKMMLLSGSRCVAIAARPCGKNTIAPMSLVNDNFHGYLDSWLYQNDITWMENSIDALLDWHDAILYR